MSLIKKELKKIVDSIPLTINYEKCALKPKDFVISASILKVEGEDILSAIFYSTTDKAPVYQVFADNENYTTFKYSDRKWSNAQISNLTRMSYYNDLEPFMDYDSLDSMICAGRYFNKVESTFSALSEFEETVNQNRLDRIHEKKKKEIDAIMKKFKSMPKFNMKWINQELFKEKQYLFFKRQGKTYTGYCTSCQHEVALTVKPVHNKEGECPHCHKNIKFKANGLAKNIADDERFDYIQRNSTGIVTRSFHVMKDLRKDKRNPIYTYYEFGRTVNFYDGRKKTYIPNTSVYTPYYGDWKPGSWSNTSYFYYHEWMLYRKTYPANYDKILRGTQWQYCQYKTFNKHQDDITLSVYLPAYSKYPLIEYLVKFKMYALAQDVVLFPKDIEQKHILNLSGKNPREIFESLNILQIQSLNLPGRDILKLRKLNASVSNEQLLWLKENVWTYDNYNDREKDFLSLLKYMSLSTAIKYLEKQKTVCHPVTIDNLLNHYADYLTIGFFNGYNYNHKEVLFPSSIEDAHEVGANNKEGRAKAAKKAREQFDDLTPEIEKAYAVRYENAKQLEYSSKKYGLSIIASKTAKDLINEGYQLQHCVGGYVSRVANGSTTIMYVRHTNAMDRSYFTIQVTDNKLIQSHGFKDSYPDDEMKAFLDEYTAKVLKSTRQTVRTIAA